MTATTERDRVKLSANLLQEDVDTLRWLASRFGTNMTDAIRRSIATQKFLVERVDRGYQIFIREPGSKTMQEVLFNLPK